MKRRKVQKLADRMAGMGHPVDVATFQRTRAGRNQSSIGSWSWSMQSAHTPVEYGSVHSVTELLAMERLVVVESPMCAADYEVMPADYETMRKALKWER